MAHPIGLIQIYTGNGKGKSTAAFGLTLRAYGQKKKVGIVQFMKNGEGYGETEAIKLLAPQVQMFSYGGIKFIKKGFAQPEDVALAGEAMNKAKELSHEVDILILDEINNALYFELITEQEILDFMSNKPLTMELILTGRNASPAMIDKADLVTEMKEIKHPYATSGMMAREGIEF